MVHRSYENLSDKIRWSMDLRYTVRGKGHDKSLVGCPSNARFVEGAHVPRSAGRGAAADAQSGQPGARGAGGLVRPQVPARGGGQEDEGGGGGRGRRGGVGAGGVRHAHSRALDEEVAHQVRVDVFGGSRIQDLRSNRNNLINKWSLGTFSSRRMYNRHTALAGIFPPAEGKAT